MTPSEPPIDVYLDRPPDPEPSDRDDLVEEDGHLVIASSGITITDAMITALRDADQR